MSPIFPAKPRVGGLQQPLPSLVLPFPDSPIFCYTSCFAPCPRLMFVGVDFLWTSDLLILFCSMLSPPTLDLVTFPIRSTLGTALV